MIESIEEALGVEPLAGEGLMMNWDQVRALCRSGHIVGSHTLTHPNLAQITEAEAEPNCANPGGSSNPSLGKRLPTSLIPIRSSYLIGLPGLPRSPRGSITRRR